MRRKIICGLLFACMLCLAACKGQAGSNACAGFYVLNENEAENDALGRARGYAYLYLAPDGSGALRMGYDDVRDVRWGDGSLTVNGKALPFSASDDAHTLTLTMDDNKLRFTYASDASPLLPQMEDMKILAAEAVTDQSGKDVVRIHFSWTNTTDAPASFYSAGAPGVMVSASQEYISLSEVEASDTRIIEEHTNGAICLLPGASISIAKDYYFDPKGIPVHVFLSRIRETDEETYDIVAQSEVTFSPEQMAQPYSPFYEGQSPFYSLPAMAKNEHMEVSIDGVKVLDDCICVACTVANLTEEEFTFNSTGWQYDKIAIRAYQCGIELDMVVLENEADWPDNMLGANFGCVFIPHDVYSFVVAFERRTDCAPTLEVVVADDFGRQDDYDTAHQLPLAAVALTFAP